ncbi:MAG: hypothetical protein GTN49_06220 [candidate division Zixibacteria bacterium]|nr:hypothetical protein [candidate division Zixibacteria bacterium]
MRVAIVLLIAFTFANTAYGGAGDVIRTFTLTGQPSKGVRGLAYDWSDGNVWAAGPNTNYDISLGKFRPATGSLVGSWRSLKEPNWCFDLGFGYRIGARRYVVLVDNRTPRIRLYTAAGSYYGSLPDPFSGGHNEGAACDWGGSHIYASNYSFTAIHRWNTATWSPWVTVPARPVMGVAAAWGRVFVVTTASDYKIYEFGAETGSLQRSIPLKNWGTRYMAGMSIGRVNAKAGEESVFLAIYYPSFYICEVSVGDISGAAVAPASLGAVKALFQ